MKYKIRKVFDCQEMPEEVKHAFFHEHPSSYNGTHIRVGVLTNVTEDGVRVVSQRGNNIVHDWLSDNGAEVGEEVLVKLWW